MSLFGGVAQCVLFIFIVKCNGGAVVPQPGTKTYCLFGEVGFIFCVLINALWLTSPTSTSKRLVHADIALTLVAFLGFVT